MNKLALFAAAALTASTFGLSAMAQDATESDFSRADGNNDGIVSWEEALGVFPTLSQTLFNQADANADGNLDEAEFTALVGLTAGAGDGSVSTEPMESSEPTAQ
jgi:hypothetical protein